MCPSVRGLTFTPFLNILHPTRRQLIFHSLSWLPTNFLGVMFPGLKERCNTVQLGEGACCTDTGHFSTALQAGLQGRRKCLVSPPTASEMVSAPGGPCSLRQQFMPQAPASHGADSTVQTASEIIFRWFGRMVSQGGEGAPCASLVQVLEGYEVNGCPHCRHCDQIAGHL